MSLRTLWAGVHTIRCVGNVHSQLLPTEVLMRPAVSALLHSFWSIFFIPRAPCRSTLLTRSSWHSSFSAQYVLRTPWRLLCSMFRHLCFRIQAMADLGENTQSLCLTTFRGRGHTGIARGGGTTLFGKTRQRHICPPSYAGRLQCVAH